MGISSPYVKYAASHTQPMSASFSHSYMEWLVYPAAVRDRSLLDERHDRNTIPAAGERPIDVDLDDLAFRKQQICSGLLE